MYSCAAPHHSTGSGFRVSDPHWLHLPSPFGHCSTCGDPPPAPLAAPLTQIPASSPTDSRPARDGGSSGGKLGRKEGAGDWASGEAEGASVPRSVSVSPFAVRCPDDWLRSSVGAALLACVALAGILQVAAFLFYAFAACRRSVSRRTSLKKDSLLLVRGLLMIAVTLQAEVCVPPAETCDGGKVWKPKFHGFEDGRVLMRAGQLYLIANHEDCFGQRHLCMVQLEGDALLGTLAPVAIWPLRLEGDGLRLQPTEKNWVPFVHGGSLYMSYSLQPHVVLRCAWSGGACMLAHNTSSDFLETYLTLEQALTRPSRDPHATRTRPSRDPRLATLSQVSTSF